MAFKLFKRKKKEEETADDNKEAIKDGEKAAENDPVAVEDAEGGEDDAPKKPRSFLNRLLRAAAIVSLTAAIIVLGFVLGVYLRIIDSSAANEELKKFDVPIIGEYLAKIPQRPETPDAAEDEPAENEKTEMQNKQAAENKPAASAQNDKQPVAPNDKKETAKEPEKKTSRPIKLTKEEIEKQTKEREAAEKKRVTKLSRLYTQMKPADAAAALENLDDNMIIAILQRMEEGQAAKILSQFDPARTARITQIMFTGEQRKITVPADLVEGADEQNTPQNLPAED